MVAVDLRDLRSWCHRQAGRVALSVLRPAPRTLRVARAVVSLVRQQAHSAADAARTAARRDSFAAQNAVGDGSGHTAAAMVDRRSRASDRVGTWYGTVRRREA